MKSGEKINVVVADANVLLAAVAQKAASKAFDFDIEVNTTSHTMFEVVEYMAKFSTYYDIPMEVLQRQFKALPIRVWDKPFYEDKMGESEKLIGKRDPEDVDILALTLKLDVPIWTNDNDFKGLGVTIYTTAKFLKILGI